MKTLLTFVTVLPLIGQVTHQRLLKASDEPGNWLTYSGSYSGQRYSLLDRITPSNAGKLGLEWVFQAESLEKSLKGSKQASK